MSNENDLRRTIFDLLTTMSGQENVIAVHRVLIDFMGDIDGALLLNQLLYWHKKGNNPEGWVYKTFNEWTEEIALSKYQVNKARRKMEAMGILETKVKKANDGSPTVHYRIKEEALTDAIVKFLHFGKLKNLTKENEVSSLTSNRDYNIDNNRDFVLQTRESKDSRNYLSEDFQGLLTPLFNTRVENNVYRGGESNHSP